MTQMRMTLAVRYLSPLRKIVAMGYGKHNKKSAFNMAVADAMRYAVKGEYPSLEIDPALVRLTKGGLYNPRDINLVRAADKLQLTFDARFDRFYLFRDDEIVLCAYNPALGIAGVNEEKCVRIAGKMELQLPVQLAEAPVQVYLFTRDRDGKRFSNSRYLGVF